MIHWCRMSSIGGNMLKLAVSIENIGNNSDLHEKISLITAAGINNVELQAVSLNSLYYKEMYQQLCFYGITVCSLHAPKNMMLQGENESLLVLKLLSIFANELHAENIVIHPDIIYRDIWFSEIAKIDFGHVSICIENTHKNIFEFLHKANKYFNCSLVFDFYHFQRLAFPLRKYLPFSIGHTHIRGVNVFGEATSLNKNIKDDELKTYLRFLSKKQYNGVYVLEYPYNAINTLRADLSKIHRLSIEIDY